MSEQQQSKDTFVTEAGDPGSTRAKTIKSTHIYNQSFKESDYEVSDLFSADEKLDERTVRTFPDFIELLETNKNIELDARVLVANKDGKLQVKKMNREEFLEANKQDNSAKLTNKFKEAVDTFQFDDNQLAAGTIGDDFVPLLGGPFNKQLYIYDYLKMHAMSFYAYHHDPIARRCVNLMRDFTLGRGWKVTCKNPIGAALWKSFEEVNDLYNQMDYISREIETYGETMIWSLPNHETKIQYHVNPGQEVPKGAIPRVRIIDPSVIWEIVTYPEDITRVLYYQWVAPTQYQIYQGRDQGQNVPGSKFIYQQIPADQVDHWKINCVSNEKRGRSSLFPVLGYMKRLRDSINYGIISLQKQAAWSIDTEIDGNSEDIDAYVSDQQSIGTIAPAGSEFIHTTKVKRTYSGNVGSKGGGVQIFDWCLSMIAAGVGIPISYLNTHLSGGQTRASALVATEPVTKMFEKRQLLYEQILQKLAKRLFKQFCLDAEIEVTFPELVVQDRSAKLEDLALAQSQGWISTERAAQIAAAELQITEFKYDIEKTKMDQQDIMPEQKVNPLSAPPKVDSNSPDVSKSDTSGENRAALASRANGS